jgi:cell division protein FtsI/penicillin-binding protein 2
MKNLLLLLLLLILGSLQIFAQGKILSKDDANQLFGDVLIKKEISTENLKLAVEKSKNVIMINIINNNLYILDYNRNVIIPEGVSVNSDVVFSVYAVSVIEDLLSKGGNPLTYIEQRKEVLTITNGDFTVDLSNPCPPMCN